MRRNLLAFLLLFAVVCGSRAYSQTQAAPPVSDSDQLRATAHRLLATGSTADAAQAADLLDKAAEIDSREAATAKARAETQQLQKPAAAESGWKVLVDVTPFLSFVIVALGFFFNSYQSRVADQQKRDEAVRQSAADEEKRWTDAITMIQKTEDFSPAASLLRTFLTGQHAALARETGASLMLTSKRFDNFRDLFNTFVEPVTADTLTRAIELLRSVSVTVGPLLTKANSAPGLTALTDAEAETYNLLVQERIFLGAKVAGILRQPRRSTEPIDLNNVGLDSADLTGADLRGCVAPYTWNMVNLDGADLRGMTGFQNTWVYNTAWWHASHIDQPFLHLLRERFPFKADQTSNTPLGISEEDYRRNLKRLETAAQ
ncbi:MAG TPA: hypothetical protein VGN01_08305 [Acidobacteriaceae bacterium]|jgi:hypothetical protein